MLDSLLITNFFYIKSLRTRVNEEPEDPDALDLSKQHIVGRFFSKQFKRRVLWAVGCLKASFLGVVHKEPMTEKKFVGWKAIPYKKGYCCTALLLILCTLFLTPDILKRMIPKAEISASPEMCLMEEMHAYERGFNETLESETRSLLAQEQVDYYNRFDDLLRRDTSLYGTAGFKCDNVDDNTPDVNGIIHEVSGTKADWENDPFVFPMSKYGNFFPGYCAAAREQALDNIANSQCTDTYCEVFKVIGIGLKTVCVEFPYVCPQHTADNESETQDYREAQYRRAAELRAARQKFFTMESIPDEVRASVSEVVDKLLFQIDVAGSVYVLYKAIGLFFPAPLQVFRQNYGPMLKSFVFGANNFLFVGLSVAIWWGFEYLRTFDANIELSLNLNLLSNPCFADASFLQRRNELMGEKCDDLLSMSNSFDVLNITIGNVLTEVEQFSDMCNCEFPFVNAQNITFPKFTTNQTIETLGLESFLPNLYAPRPDMPFFGNVTICTDPSYARTMLHPPETSATMWDVWIKTGLLATFFVKIAMSNFAVALLRVADPFSICNGKFECPPERYSLLARTQDLLEMKEDKEAILTALGVRSAIFWGLLTNLSLVNIFLGEFMNQGGGIDLSVIEKSDAMLFGAFIAVATVWPILVYFREELRQGIICCYQSCTGANVDESKDDPEVGDTPHTSDVELDSGLEIDNVPGVDLVAIPVPAYAVATPVQADIHITSDENYNYKPSFQ